MAKDWFEFNGVNCRTYGIYVTELPPITLAEERVEFTDIPGRSGSLAQTEGQDVYDDIVLSCQCVLTDLAQLPAVAAWLRGAGTVTFANRSGGWYEGRVVEQIELEKIIAVRDARRFSLSFRCKPFFYHAGAADIVVTTASAQIVNPGNVASAPRIKVYGSGDVLLTIGGQQMALTGLTDGIILDTALQDALDLTGSVLVNDMVSGDFLTIPAGTSTIAWLAQAQSAGGSISRIEITPRWRSR